MVVTSEALTTVTLTDTFYYFFIWISASSDNTKKHVVLDCLLSRLQQRGNVIPAWIVVISHWTTVSLSTARNCPDISAGLCLLYCPGVVPACFRQGLYTKSCSKSADFLCTWSQFWSLIGCRVRSQWTAKCTRQCDIFHTPDGDI